MKKRRRKKRKRKREQSRVSSNSNPDRPREPWPSEADNTTRTNEKPKQTRPGHQKNSRETQEKERTNLESFIELQSSANGQGFRHRSSAGSRILSVPHDIETVQALREAHRGGRDGER
jgi:hypothetical protein